VIAKTEWYLKTVVVTLKEVTVNLTAVAIMECTLMRMVFVLLKVLLKNVHAKMIQKPLLVVL